MSRPRRRASAEKTRPSMFWVAALAIPVVNLLAKIEIRGGENLPERGAFVLAPNHYSELDPLVCGVVVWRLGRAPRFMAKESLFHVPVVGAVLRKTGMVPVARSASSAGAKQTIAQATQLVDLDRGVIVYPEGTLTRDPELWPMRGKSGAVRLALAAGLPVIPAASWGVEQIMPRYGKLRLWPLRKRVQYAIGRPMDLSGYVGADGHPLINAATDAVMAEISSLLGELRGQTPPLTRWNPAEHGQKETGRLDS